MLCDLMHLSTYSPNFTPSFFYYFYKYSKTPFRPPFSPRQDGTCSGNQTNTWRLRTLLYYFVMHLEGLALTSQTLPKYSLHTYSSPWGIWGAFVSISCFQKRFGIPETVPLLSASLTFPLIWFRKHLERALPPRCKLSQNDIYWMEMPCTALQQAHSYH